MRKGDLITLIAFAIWGVLALIMLITMMMGIVPLPLFFFIFIASTFAFFLYLVFVAAFSEPKKQPEAK
jgi:hypothetical protein